MKYILFKNYVSVSSVLEQQDIMLVFQHIEKHQDYYNYGLFPRNRKILENIIRFWKNRNDQQYSGFHDIEFPLHLLIHLKEKNLSHEDISAKVREQVTTILHTMENLLEEHGNIDRERVVNNLHFKNARHWDDILQILDSLDYAESTEKIYKELCKLCTDPLDPYRYFMDHPLFENLSINWRQRENLYTMLEIGVSYQEKKLLLKDEDFQNIEYDLRIMHKYLRNLHTTETVLYILSSQHFKHVKTSKETFYIAIKGLEHPNKKKLNKIATHDIFRHIDLKKIIKKKLRVLSSETSMESDNSD